jgi:hypothetical protein
MISTYQGALELNQELKIFRLSELWDSKLLWEIDLPRRIRLKEAIRVELVDKLIFKDQSLLSEPDLLERAILRRVLCHQEANWELKDKF